MDITDTLVYLGYLCGAWGLGWCAGFLHLQLKRMFEQV